MADFDPQDVRQMFSEDVCRNLGDDGIQRVINSMKRLQILRREEIEAVAFGIKMRLSPPQQSPAAAAPAAAPVVLLRAGGGAVVSPAQAPTPAALVPELDELQRRLARLQLALDMGVITAAEYATKRAKVIEDSL